MDRTAPAETDSALSQPPEPTWATVWQEFHRAGHAPSDARGPRRGAAKKKLTAASERRRHLSVDGRLARRYGEK